MAMYRHACTNYRKIASELSTRRRPYSRMYSNLTGLLIRWGATHFTQHEMQVLFFIIGRTLLFGKCGERIARSQFIDGVHDQDKVMVAAGLSMRLATLKDVLKSLAERDYIHCHAFERENGIENVPRIYEVNYSAISTVFNDFYCRKLTETVKELRSLDELYRRKTQKVVEAIEKTGAKNVISLPVRREKRVKKGGPQGQEEGVSPVYPKDIEINTNKDLFHKSAAPLRRTALDEEKDVGKKIEVNCKNPKEIASAIKQKHTDTRAGRADAARTVTAKRWTVTQLQALLDSARAQALADGYTVPRVVAVARGAGVLHKRLLSYGITDAFDFLYWTMVNWPTVASANFRAKQKNPEKASNDAMLQVPNFNDLAYRCPYIIAFYNDNKITKEIATKQKLAEEQNEKTAKAAAEQARSERIARTRELDRQRDRERKARDETLQRKLKESQKRDIKIDDIDLPSLDEWERRRGSKA